MKAYIFPGQASQFVGMGKELYENSDCRRIMDRANEILGYDLIKLMFEGPDEALKETRVTQPAVFIHSIATVTMAADAFQPKAVAGHSLGELSALVAARSLSYEDGLKLVKERAEAMQDACEQNPGTMAAIVGLDDSEIEKICAGVDDVVVAANYNCPGQLVISGSHTGVSKAVEACKSAGARMAIELQVGGAFHSSLMLPAQEKLAAAIDQTQFQKPAVPVYQNVHGRPVTDPQNISANLKKQLTAPVRWAQTMKNMLADGVDEFIEVGGNGKVLSGFVKRVDRSIPTSSLTELIL